MRKEASWWLEQGKENFDVAKQNLKLKKYHVVAFYSQQAVEALIKAIIYEILKDIPPASHNLVDALTLLEKKEDIPTEIYTAARYLTAHYLASRYPDVTDGVPYKNYDEEIAELCLKKAEVVLLWAQKILKKS